MKKFLYICITTLIATTASITNARIIYGDQLTLSSTQSDNTYMIGSDILVNYPLLQDFFGIGSKILIKKLIHQDAQLIGGTIFVDAPIHEDFKAAGIHVQLNTTISGDLLTLAGNFESSSQTIAHKRAYIMAQTATIRGNFYDDLTIVGSDITFDAVAHQDVLITADRITIGPNAKISGNLIYKTPAPYIPLEAITYGSKTHETIKSNYSTNNYDIGYEFWFLTIISYMLIIRGYTIFSKGAKNLTTAPRSLIRKGFVVVISISGLIVLSTLSLIGLPLAGLLIMLMIAMFLTHKILCIALYGTIIIQKIDPPHGRQRYVIIGGVVAGLSFVLTILSGSALFLALPIRGLIRNQLRGKDK